MGTFNHKRLFGVRRKFFVFSFFHKDDVSEGTGGKISFDVIMLSH